jgi:hypothetical protein
LHTSTGRKLPIGRKLLGLMGVQCPLDRVPLTAQQVEASRHIGLAALRGQSPAPAHPSLAGLRLNVTTEAQALVWARARGIDCIPQARGMRFLKCHDVSQASLTLGFDSRGRLVAVDVFRHKLRAREASELMRRLSQALSTRLGRPTETIGELSPRFLDGGREMRTSFVNFQFEDYVALLTATHLPWTGGVAVHEQYSVP